jgi:hypothetical protein
MNNGQQVGLFAGLHDNWKVDKSQLALCAIMCESSALGVDGLVFNGFVVWSYLSLIFLLIAKKGWE